MVGSGSSRRPTTPASTSPRAPRRRRTGRTSGASSRSNRSTTSAAHRKIVCIRTPAGGFRSFTGTGGSGLAGTGEPVTTFDYFELRPEHYHFAGPETGTGGTPLRYRTTFRAAIHEFGHILGLKHPDKHVHTGGGPHDEYGESRAAREDVMGYGCKMDASSAVPWLNRIAEHTGIPAARWTVKLGPDSPALRPKQLGG